MEAEVEEVLGECEGVEKGMRVALTAVSALVPVHIPAELGDSGEADGDTAVVDKVAVAWEAGQAGLSR